MNNILAALAIVVVGIGASYGVIQSNKPESVATAVIGEKPTGSRLGNQVAVKLPKNISEKQAHLMRIAYEKGQQVGFKRPEIIQSLILQETLAGGLKQYKVANPGPEAYFGPAQIKLAATKDVLKRHPYLFEKYDFHTRTDDEIKANLILNEKFNIEVGALYLKLLQDVYKFEGRQLLNAYNRGPGGVKKVDNSFHYAIEAERKLAAWKAKNGKHKENEQREAKRKTS